VSLQVIFSPQWWIWIATLLVPLTGRRRWLLAAVAVGELFTYATFPLLFEAIAFEGIDPDLGEQLREWNVWVRAALWGGIFGALLLEEKRPPAATPP
jgi:hypothetical protein